MLSIIDRWLKGKLGIILTPTKSIGSALQDGKVIAMLLEKYGIMSNAQVETVHQTSNVKQCFRNLLFLKKWFNLLSLDINECEIGEMAKGKDDIAQKFMYQLYLKLETFDLTKPKMNDSKLRVMLESNVCTSDCNFSDQQMDLREKNFMLALRRKQKMVAEKYTCRGSGLHHSLESSSVALKIDRCNEIENVNLMIESFEDAQRKQEEKGVQNKPRVQFHSKINWEEVIEKAESEIAFVEDEVFLNQFVEKLIKQSRIEREMGQQMHRLNHQQNVLFNTKQLIDRVSERQRGRSLMALVENYSRSMEEKKAAQQQEIELRKKEEDRIIENHLIRNACKDVVETLICIALKIVQVRFRIVPKEVWRMWKQQFIKDECVGDDLSDWNFEWDENVSNLSSATYQLDRQETLVEADVDDYLNFRRQWESHVSSQPAQNILGFIVTKLLELLSMAHISPKKLPLPEFSLAISLHGIPDNFNGLLKQIFEKNDVLLLTTEYLINDAILRYKQETNPSEIVENFSVASRASRGKKKNESRKIQEDFETANPGSENLNKTDQSEPTLSLTKATQAPDILSEHDFAEPPLITEQMIVEKLLLGDPISPELIVKVLLNRLMESAQWKGWIILDFPRDILEAQELESNLKGQIVPLRENLNADSSNETISQSKLVPFKVNAKFDDFTPYLSHYINVKSKCSSPPSKDMTLICKFYKQFGRYQEFDCNEEVDFESIQSVVQNILAILDQSFLEKSHSQIFEGIDLSGYIDKKGNQKSNMFLKVDSKEEGNTLEDQLKRSYVDEITLQEEGSMTFSNFEISLERFQEFDIASSFLVPLAENWKAMESNYLQCLRNSFALKRAENAKMIAYGEYVNILFDECIEDDTDKKQKLLDQFIVNFNSICLTQRLNLNTKSVLHKRIFELQNKLWEMCDENKRQREHTVQLILKSDWFIHHLNVMCDVYVSMLNEEVQRHMDTMQILADYYLLALKKIPAKTKMQVATKRIDLMENQYEAIHNCVNYADDKGFNVSFDSIEEPLHSIFNFFKHQIDSMSVITREFEKLEKTISTEMQFAVLDEKQRVTLRIELIEENLFKELKDFQNWFSRLLNDQFEKLKARYKTEIGAVDALAKVLSIVVEEEKSLNETLHLERNQFFIGHKNWKLHQHFSPQKTLSLMFHPQKYSFTAGQLERLRELLQNVAPHGVLSNILFVYVLQDVQTDESLSHALPRSWKNLTGAHLNNIVSHLFGQTLTCDWKDFIIYAFEMPFPSVNQLITSAKQFKSFDQEGSELIYLDDYSRLRLWFEEDLAESPEATLHLIKLKEILFKLFQVDEYRSNYSQLLLRLCKDEDPRMGFVKALSVTHCHEVDFYTSEDDASRGRHVHGEILPLTKISYKCLRNTLENSFYLQETQLLEDCMDEISSEFGSEEELCATDKLLRSPCLLKLLHSVHKFKALYLNEAVYSAVENFS